MPPQQTVVGTPGAIPAPPQDGAAAAAAAGGDAQQQRQQRNGLLQPASKRRPVDPSVLRRGVQAGIADYERAKEEQAKANADAQRRTYEDVRLEKEAGNGEVQEAAQEVDFIKAGANAAFKRALSSDGAEAAAAFDEALESWAEALDACARPPLAATATSNRLVEMLRCNRAAALLKVERFAEARRECELALAVNPDCIKALYRGAEALYELGGFSKAIALLERALRFDPNSYDVRKLLDDCEDALEEEGDQLVEDEAGARGQGAQAQGVNAAGGADAGAGVGGAAGDGKANDSIPSDEDDAACVEFARALMAQTAETWLDTGGEHEEEIVSRHLRPDGVEQTGKFQVAQAFDSEAMLEECTGWIRQQHVITAADALLVSVAKRKVRFPTVWWAGDWPEELDLDGDGVFFELETKRGFKRSWFMAADTDEASVTKGHLLDAVALPHNCRLLTKPLFPRPL